MKATWTRPSGEPFQRTRPAHQARHRPRRGLVALHRHRPGRCLGGWADLESDGRYPVGSPLVQASMGGDAANLILGLPALLGAMWLTRRGSLIGLLLWPGALFNVLYAYALGAVLLWRRATLGYVAATGLLLVSGLNGLAFAASAVLDGLLAGRSIESAVVAVHLVISGVSFALLAFLDRDAAGRKPVGQPGISSAQEEAAR